MINVVTLGAAKTQGAALALTAGNLEKAAVGRYGLTFSDDVAVRVHAKTFERGPSQLRAGGDASDAARGTSAGIYAARTDERPVYGAVDLSGSNVTARWSRRLDETSDFDVQAYVDGTQRTDRFLLQEDARIFDVEAKYRQTAGSHRWLAGLGYRHARDHADPA